MSGPTPDADLTTSQPAPLLSVAHQIAERGVYGLAWLDPDLNVTSRFGPITEALSIGDPISTGLPMLLGYETEIKELTATETSVFNLPSVKLITPEREEPRLKLTVFPDSDSPGYILLIGRVLTASDSDVELTNQMRARLIAEEEVARKSRELAVANAELELANRDLEDYAAVISHDLKSPLRAMRYIADDIEHALKTDAPNEARKALATLKGQSRRMSSMLGALLDYASVGRKSDMVEQVDTKALLTRIVGTMPVPVDFRISIDGDWPILSTVLAPLDVVIRNLIDNAIKHHDRPSGHIVLMGTPAAAGQSTFVFSVLDDGPGISHNHQEAVFLPFRTLSGATEDDASSGMGLAFVRRTIETVGGTINVISDPAKTRGTKFEITWPCELTRDSSGPPSRTNHPMTL